MSKSHRHPEPFPWLCSQCGGEEVYPGEIEYETTVKYEGRPYDLKIADLPVLQCRVCEEVLFNNDSDARIAEVFRQQLGLLTPQQIRDGRKQLNLNQREFAETLGVAEESISRWETGVLIQSRVVDKAIRLFFQSPDARRVLVQAKQDPTIGTTVKRHEAMSDSKRLDLLRELLEQEIGSELSSRVSGSYAELAQRLSEHWVSVRRLWGATASLALHAPGHDADRLAEWLGQLGRDYQAHRDLSAVRSWTALCELSKLSEASVRGLQTLSEQMRDLPSGDSEQIINDFTNMLKIALRRARQVEVPSVD